ncbi:MAG: pseudouridine synthase [Terracidiphilus sp.]
MTDEQSPELDGPETDPEQESVESAETDDAAREPAEESFAPHPPAQLERLQKILAQAGIASRRAAEELIREGRVQVNGQIVTELGTKADAARDHIRVDGKLLHGAERLRYFVLNKPRGYVTTVKDPEGRPTVMEFFAKTGERLYPVGRLDYMSEGLLLITNDGPLANALTRAASGVEKTYLVKVAGQPGEELLEQLRAGVSIDRGRRDEGKRRGDEGKVQTAPARIRQVRPGDNPWFEVVLIEGRNRELRKMFEEIGHHVEKIRRVGYGPLVLDQEPGKMRELEPMEVEALRLTAAGKLKPKRIKSTRLLPKDAGLHAEQREAKTVRLKRGGRQAGRGFKPNVESRFKGGFKPRSESGFKPGFKPKFQPGAESAPESAPESRPRYRSESRPPFGAQSRFGSSSGFLKSGPARSGSARSGSDRPFGGAKPAWPSKGGPTGKPTGRPAGRQAQPFRGKPSGKPTDRPFGGPARPFKSEPAGRETGRPARPFTGKPEDRPTRTFKAKPFGKAKTFGKPGFRERTGERAKEPSGKGSGERVGERAGERTGQPFRPRPGSGSGPRKDAFGTPDSGARKSSTPRPGTWKSGGGKPGSGPRKSAGGKPGSGARKSSSARPGPGSWKGGSKPASGSRGGSGGGAHGKPGGGRGSGKGPFRPGGKRGGR